MPNGGSIIGILGQRTTNISAFQNFTLLASTCQSMADKFAESGDKKARYLFEQLKSIACDLSA